MSKPVKPHLRVVVAGDEDIVDTGPAAMAEYANNAAAAVTAAKLNRLLEARNMAHDLLEIIARDGSVAQTMHFLRSETKLFAERMKP